LLLESFCTPEYVFDILESEKNSRLKAVTHFFEFVFNNEESKRYKLFSPYRMQYKIIGLWIENLKQTKSTYSSWHFMNRLLKVTNLTLKRQYGTSINWPTQCYQMWSSLNELVPPKPIHKKKLPIGMRLGIDSEFSNTELLYGLRIGCIWLLQTLSTQRATVRNNAEVSKHLAKIQITSLRKFATHSKKLFDSYRHGRSRLQDKKVKLASSIYHVIKNDDLLAEWQFYSHPKLKRSLCSIGIMSLEDYRYFLSLYPLPSKHSSSLYSTRRQNNYWKKVFQPIFSGTNQPSAMNPCFWSETLITPSALEKRLMVWLLSSDRIQHSGIKTLRLQDVTVTGNKNKQLQMSWTKNRRESAGTAINGATVFGDIYRQNTPMFNVYHDWLNFQLNILETVSDYNESKLFLPMLAHEILGLQLDSNLSDVSNDYLPIKLLTIKNSQWQNKFLNDAGEENQREARAFIRILVAIQERNHRGHYKSLPIDSIGQSLVVEKHTVSSKTDMEKLVDAETSGHNQTTNKNIYIDRFSSSGVRELIEPIHHFARSIGDQKFKIAFDISQRLAANSKRVSIHELESICGISSVATDIKNTLDLLDEQNKLTLSGEIQHDGTLYIAETDMTAALMWSYIQHLTSSLEGKKIDITDEGLLSRIGKLIFLHQSFDQFDATIKKEGKQLASEMEFPFPPLTGAEA